MKAILDHILFLFVNYISMTFLIQRIFLLYAENVAGNDVHFNTLLLLEVNLTI
jgi:hypothetical protein